MVYSYFKVNPPTMPPLIHLLLPSLKNLLSHETEFHIVIGSKKCVGRDQFQHIFKNNRLSMILIFGVSSPLPVTEKFNAH